MHNSLFFIIYVQWNETSLVHFHYPLISHWHLGCFCFPESVNRAINRDVQNLCGMMKTLLGMFPGAGWKRRVIWSIIFRILRLLQISFHCSYSSLYSHKFILQEEPNIRFQLLYSIEHSNKSGMVLAQYTD